jgi:hypothetical protein
VNGSEVSDRDDHLYADDIGGIVGRVTLSLPPTYRLLEKNRDCIDKSQSDGERKGYRGSDRPGRKGRGGRRDDSGIEGDGLQTGIEAESGNGLGPRTEFRNYGCTLRVKYDAQYRSYGWRAGYYPLGREYFLKDTLWLGNQG